MINEICSLWLFSKSLILCSCCYSVLINYEFCWFDIYPGISVYTCYWSSFTFWLSVVTFFLRFSISPLRITNWFCKTDFYFSRLKQSFFRILYFYSYMNKCCDFSSVKSRFNLKGRLIFAELADICVIPPTFGWFGLFLSIDDGTFYRVVLKFCWLWFGISDVFSWVWNIGGDVGIIYASWFLVYKFILLNA